MSLADVLEPAADARPARLRGRQDLHSRPTTTPSGSTPSPRPASCSSGTARRPRSAARFATPTSPTPTTCSRSAGIGAFYRGALAREIVEDRAQAADERRTDLPVPQGLRCGRRTSRGTTSIQRRPTHVGYRGLDVYGMAPSSSGGTTVGEALNILERYDLAVADAGAGAAPRTSRPAHLAFADRGASTSATRRVDVPLARLLSDTYAAERACQIDPLHAFTPAGRGRRRRGVRRQLRHARPARPRPRRTPRASTPPTSPSPTSEATSSSTRSPSSRPAAPGSCVPGRGFLLNNELTDFSAVYDAGRPEPDRARQAAAQLDVADDRAQGRQAVPRARLAGRLDDHHHGARDPGQPARPRHVPGAGDRGAARGAAQHRRR